MDSQLIMNDIVRNDNLMRLINSGLTMKEAKEKWAIMNGTPI